MSTGTGVWSKTSFDVLEDGIGLPISLDNSDLSNLSKIISDMGYSISMKKKLVSVKEKKLFNKTTLYITSQYPVKYIVLDYNSLKGDKKEAYQAMQKIVSTDLIKNKLMVYWNQIGVNNKDDEFRKLIKVLVM